MQRSFTRLLMLCLIIGSVLLLSAGIASADSASIDFEGFTIGVVHAQSGWSSLGPAGSGANYDHRIVDPNTFGVAAFGNRALRVSNAVTSSAFGDQTFSQSLVDEAGETSAENGGMSGGTRQKIFEASWDFTSADPTNVQTGLAVVISPDRGDGARMSWIQLVDNVAGLGVNFFEYQAGVGFPPTSTPVATGLDRTQIHNVRVVMKFIEGVDNDVVEVYVNGILLLTGGSWEDFFRENQPPGSRTVDSLLFRTAGIAAPATAGKGFLIDNIQLSSYNPPQCTTVCYVSPTGSDSNGGTSIADAKLTIQAAIDQVNLGGQVRVLPGTYSETASGRTLFDGSGPYTFGLFFDEDKPGITVMGVTAADVPITDPSAVLARVNTNATNGFGPSGIFVDAANITIQGLEIGTNASGQNKTIEVIGDNFTLQHSYVNDPDGSVYINDFTAAGTRVLAYKIDNNRFAGGVSVDLASGAGLTGPVSGRVITNNTFTNSTAFDQNWPMISFNGSDTGVPWFVNSVGGAIITGNEFTHNDADVMDDPTLDQEFIRARGTYDNSQFDWQSYWEDNTYNKATVALVGATGFDVRTYSYPGFYGTFNNVRRIGGEIQPEVNHTVDGDRVLINRNTIAGGAASYPEQVTVSNKDITLQGVAEADVIIVPPITTTTVAGVIAQVTFDGGSVAQMYDLTVDGPIHDDGCAPDAFGVYVHDGSSLTAESITVNDSNLGTASLYGCQTGIGIFVGGDSAATTGTATLTDVTVTNYQKGGIVATNAGSSVSVSSSTISAATFVQPFIAPNGVQVSDGATGTIITNTISQNKCDLGGGECGPIGVGTFQAAGIIIFDSPSVLIDGNTITDNDMGVYNFGTDTTIIQNYFTANRYTGIFADEGLATIEYNLIDGGDYGVLAYGFDTAMFTSIASDSVANLTFNIFTNTSVALALIDDNPADGFKPVIKANRNSIIGGTGTGSNDESFRNNTTVSMDIECNWWGDAAGPYDDNTGGPGPSSSGELYGPGDFTPWLLSSDLNGPCSTVLPNAVDDDSYTTPFNTPLVVAAPGVLSNDTGTSITVTANSAPSSGTLTVNPVAGSGGFTFTPALNFSGVVTFTYTITDSFGQTDTATVTITVGQPGSITVNKVVNVVRGTAPTNTFEVCVSGGSLSAPVCQNVMGGSNVTFSNLTPGAYTVSETNPGANWTVTGGGSVTVVSNETASTTITNTYEEPLPQTGSITVSKDVTVLGNNPPTNTFEICVSGGTLANPVCQNVTGGSSVTFSNLTPGSYTVTETNPGTGWTVTGSGASVTVAANQTATATITNTWDPARGSLTVNKVVNVVRGTPNTNTFEICIDNGNLSIPLCQNVTGGSSVTFSNLYPDDDYVVTETAPGANWTVTGNSAVVAVVSNETATTTITNTYEAPLPATGSISVTKVVNVVRGTAPTNTFEVCVSGGNTYPVCQNVMGGSSVTFSNLAPGAYTVSETNPGANWTVTGGGSVTVVSNETASTTITNTYEAPLPATGSISVTKNVTVLGNNPPTNTFEICVSGGTLVNPVCQSVTGGTTATFSNLTPGSYTVTETNPGTGWTVTGSGANVTVAANQTATATITNTWDPARGSLTVNKVVNVVRGTPNTNTFEICIDNGNLSIPLCQNVTGGSSVTFSNLYPDDDYVVTETAPGANWTVTGNGAVVAVVSNQTATTTITNTYEAPLPATGSISVTKVVNVVRGTAPTNTFEVCVSGSSLSAPVCQNVNGGSSVTFSNLAPGAYTVSETNPGANWTVTGGGIVTVVSNETATTTITNTYEAPLPATGSISVSKVVNVVRGTAPTNTFEVCVSGGNTYPVCQNVMGGSSVTFSNLAPGQYTVSETNPGANWTVTGGGSVTVVSNQTASTTITNTYAVPGGDPMAEPDLSCPAGLTQIGGPLTGTIYINGRPSLSHTFSSPLPNQGMLMVASMVGHPDNGCPASGGWTCNQGQDNEEFNILLNGSQVAFIPDHGEDRWEVFTVGGVSFNSDNSITFAHTMRMGNNEWGSVTYKAIACLEMPIEEAPVEAEEAVIETELLLDESELPADEAPANTAPTAQDDGTDVGQDQPLTLDVLGNDSDADGDALTVIAVSQPANGIAIINGDGSIGYLPNAGFTGSDPFMYTIDDGRGGTASAIIWITVR